MTDWSASGRRDSIRVTLVAPGSLDSVIGELANVEPDGCSVSEGYYEDTRASARVRTVGEDGYVDHAWMRVVHEVPADGYREELFTGPVTDMKREREDGTVVTDYSLDSSLYAIKNDLLVGGWTVGAGARLTDVARALLRTCGRPSDVSRAQEHVFASTTMYERGEGALTVLMDACGSYDRVTVDGHGRVVVERYLPPSSREPSQDVDPASPRSVVLGEVSTSDSAETTPGRVIYVSGSGDREVVAEYTAPPGADSSSQVRGYMYAVKKTDDTQDASYSSLLARAKSSWQESQDPGREHVLTVMWQAWHQGDVVRLRTGGTWRKCLVKSVESSLGDMTQRVTLKEV